jgi:hypothetical protein
MALFNPVNFVTLATSATTYAANIGDIVVAPAALGAGCTITLPPVSQGAEVVVKNLTTTPRTLTVKTNEGSSTSIDGIAGNTGIALAAEYDTVVLASDGANWYLLSGGPATASV